MPRKTTPTEPLSPDRQALAAAQAGTYLSGKEVEKGELEFVLDQVTTDTFRDGVKTVVTGSVNGVRRRMVLSRRLQATIGEILDRKTEVRGEVLTLFGIPTTRPDGTPCLGIAAKWKGANQRQLGEVD